MADMPQHLLSSKVAQEVNVIISKDPSIWIEGSKIEDKGARGATSTRRHQGGVSKRQMYVFTTSPPISKEIIGELREAGFHVANTKKPMWEEDDRTFKEYAVRPTKEWFMKNRALEAKKVANDPASDKQKSYAKELLWDLVEVVKSQSKDGFLRRKMNEMFDINFEEWYQTHTSALSRINELENKINAWNKRQMNEFFSAVKPALRPRYS